jgi:hypothetical protein
MSQSRNTDELNTRIGSNGLNIGETQRSTVENAKIFRIVAIVRIFLKRGLSNLITIG